MEETTLKKVKKERIFWLYDKTFLYYVPFKKLQYNRSEKAFVVQMMVYKKGELVACGSPVLMRGDDIVYKRREKRSPTATH